MRPFRGGGTGGSPVLWCCALAALAMANGSAAAAWNNVFQVCCHNCRSSNSVAVPATPAPCNGCQQQCTTRYVQRCYYRPVTTYRRSCYMEPVTTYRTSYYYEPCTSYRYSCYFDPCTCSYQQVAQPVTTYRLRSRCCPVTSYLQRCCLQPVTNYQKVTYYEPQTTCCTTTIGAPVAAPPCSAPAAAAPPPAVEGAAVSPPPGVSAGPNAAPPGVSGQPNNPPPAVNGTAEPPPPGQGAGATSINRRLPRKPGSDGSSYRQPRLQAPVPVKPRTPAQKPPRLRFERITSTPRPNTEGRVLRADRRPQTRTKVIFICADKQGVRRSLTTDDSGRFRTTLTAGNWLIYTQNASGRLVYQQKVRVGASTPAPPITLVSR